MTLPAKMREDVEKILTDYCERKVPERVRNMVRLTFVIQGNFVTLLEQRPHFRDPAKWIDSPIAKFRYHVEGETWMLYWPDSNLRWHKYAGLGSRRTFETLLAEVDKDPTHIFWG